VSVTYIPVELRRAVISRAERLCEYCLIHEDDTFFGCQVDHIIAEKHGGETSFANLAMACTNCNRAKGSDIGTLVNGVLVRFFSPRSDIWAEHFALAHDGITIIAKSEIGQATTKILAMNTAERLLEREMLCEAERYPSRAAKKRIDSTKSIS
jgi:hypothetical protein